MPVGLEITNPSGTLVLSSEAAGYRYLGQPTLITSGSVDKYHYTTPPYDYWWGTVNPYVYEITLPSTGYPLVGLKLTSSSYVELYRVYNTSGNTWRIEVFSFNSSYSMEDLDLMVLVAPTVYVFCPYSNADAASGAGLQLFDSSGNLTFTSRFKPLWLRQSALFSQASAETDGTYWVNQTLWVDGQSVTYTSMTAPVILNCNGNALTTGTKDESGETIFTGSAAWTVSGSTVNRKRFIYNRETRAIETGDLLELQMYETRPIFIEEGNI